MSSAIRPSTILTTMVFTVDHLGHVLSTNQIGAAELGYEVAELIGQPVSRFYPPEDRAYADGQIGQCVAEPGSIHRWKPARCARMAPSSGSAKPPGRSSVSRVGQACWWSRKTSPNPRRRSEQLAYHANHDMTGLVNRRAFEERLELALAVARAEQVEYALCYLDLDQFKVINDSCGHVAGDEFLRQLSRVLQES